MNHYRAKIGKAGRVVVPAALRRRLGLQPGDEVVLHLEADAVRIVPLERAVRRAQQRVRRHVRGRLSLVDRLIAQRRRETRGE